jgi:hypothetical protein
MTVNPGFGGQAFLPSQLAKIATLRRMVDAADHRIALAVDGGIGPDTARLAVQAGADTLIAGTAVFGAADYATAIAALRAAGAATIAEPHAAGAAAIAEPHAAGAAAIATPRAAGAAAIAEPRAAGATTIAAPRAAGPATIATPRAAGSAE